MRIKAKATTRLPVHLEMIGGKSQRQRIWEQVREQRGFNAASIEDKTRINQESISEYLRALEKAGYVKSQPRQRTRTEKFTHKAYELVKDVGIEAPRLNKNGKSVKQGLGNEQMWRTMHILKGWFSAEELARNASTPEVPIKNWTAKTYCAHLKNARYLECRTGCHGRTPDTFRLVNYTGPRPPMIQRLKQVYDPNLGRVMYADDPAEAL